MDGSLQGSASKASSSPIKNKAHQLQVKNAWKTKEPDLPGSILLALTALTEVSIVPFQFLFLWKMITSHQMKPGQTQYKICQKIAINDLI